MTMDYETFKTSLSSNTVPDGVSEPLHALWKSAKGDWHEAHRIVQENEGPVAAWVHAHLHRVEGDLANAAYWYRRAGRPVCESPLEEEWEAIVTELLEPDQT